MTITRQAPLSRPTHPRRARSIAVVTATAVLVAAGCSSGTDTTEQAWPDPSWTTASAEDAGLDADALDALASLAEAAGSYCLVVTRNGYLVDEHYWNDTDESTPHEAFSITKSMASVLVGIAQDRGQLDIDDPVAGYVPEWRDTPSEAVTVRHLMSNDSGRELDDDEFSLFVEDKTATAIGLDQQHPPGTVWEYNNAATQVLDAVLSEATATPVDEFARTELFDPLGMEDSTFVRDSSGNSLTFSGAETTCRDLARFGLLVLREGAWEDERIVSSAWIETSTAPSQDLNPAYGLLWWLNRPGDNPDPDLGGHSNELAPDVDIEIVAGVGLGGQAVAVFPASDIVVTRMAPGDNDADTPAFSAREIALGVEAALQVSDDG